MKINSTRFGTIEVPDADIIEFPGGLPGFAGEKRFAFLPHSPESPFFFLQSAVNPDLTFVITSPFLYFPDYEFKLDDDFTAQLGLSEENPPEVYSIVTVPEKVEHMTANLIAPLIINRKGRIGAQVVLEKTSYTTRHRLLPDAKEKPAEGGR